CSTSCEGSGDGIVRRLTRDLVMTLPLPATTPPDRIAPLLPYAIGQGLLCEGLPTRTCLVPSHLSPGDSSVLAFRILASPSMSAALLAQFLEVPSQIAGSSAG